MLEVRKDGKGFQFYRSEPYREAGCKPDPCDGWYLLLWQTTEVSETDAEAPPGWFEACRQRGLRPVQMPTVDAERAPSAVEAIRRCLEWVEATEAERVDALAQLGRIDAAETAHEAARVARAIKARKAAAV